MQCVRSIVNGKAVLFTVEREAAFTYAIGITAGSLSGTRAVTEIIYRIFITECNIVPSLSGTTMLTIPAPRLDNVTDAPDALVNV